MRNIPYTIIRNTEFNEWLNGISKSKQLIIEDRIERLSWGHFGDHKRFEGLIELRWRNGFRVYCFNKSNKIIIVLLGGNKNGQSKDIRKAKKIKETYIYSTCAFHKS